MPAEIEHAERIAVLETQVADLKRAVDDMAADVKILVKAFDQAKGARWLLVTMAAIGGFLAGKGALLTAWVGAVK